MPLAAKNGALLAESLTLVSQTGWAVVAASKPDPFGTFDHDAARKQLHDELLRYLLSVNHYIQTLSQGAKLDYVFAPRLAIAACTSRAGRSRVRLAAKAPRLSRPCQLESLLTDVRTLRSMVDVSMLTKSLTASFGDAMKTVFDPTALPGAGLGQLIAETLGRFATGANQTSGFVTGTDGQLFGLHRDVAGWCENVLTRDLPFGERQATLPIRDLLNRLDQIEGAITSTLSPAGARPSDQMLHEFLPWGLALTALARVYLVDLLTAFVSVSWPIGRLYWEDPDVGKQTMPLFTSPDKDDPVSENGVYNAYLAIALIEALRGEPMPHPEVPFGYLLGAREAPRLPGADQVADFATYWADGAPAFHPQTARKLKDFAQAPVLVPRPERRAAAPAPMTVDAFVEKIVLRHTYPSWLPVGDRDPTNLWKQGARFSAQLGLLVAGQLMRLLDGKVHPVRQWHRIKNEGRGGPYRWVPPKDADKQYVLRLWSGSLRWGGNHPPHLEHRDGMTFDIEHYFYFAPWPQAKAHPITPVGRKQSPPPTVKTLVVCNTVDQVNRHALVKDRVFPVLDQPRAGVKQAVPVLLNAIVKNLVGRADLTGYDPRTEWEDLVGMPIHRDSANGTPDDRALRSNLVGHVALALAGVRKWVHASPMEHLFAMRAIAQLGNSLPAALRKPVMLPEYVFKPEDHYDHWHVVFRDFSAYANLEQWLALWDLLGVDLETIAGELGRHVVTRADEFPDVVNEQATLVRALKKATENKRAGADVSDPPLDRLADGITAASYSQVTYDEVGMETKGPLFNFDKHSGIRLQQYYQLEMPWQVAPTTVDPTPDKPGVDISPEE